MLKKNVLPLAIAASLPALLSVCAFGQTAAKPAPSTEDEIVVRAQFLAPAAKSALKLDIDVRDTPFTVSSYSDSFMKAIETTNIADLYNYMTGIQRGGVTGYDLSIRGFKTTANDKNAILVDGLPGLAGRFGSPPTVGTERIEVVKGPASVLYGQSQPGGFVNIISKKPQPVAAAYIDLRGSTYWGDKFRAGNTNGNNFSGDITGSLNADKTVMARVIVEASDRNLFRDYTSERGEYFVPSLTWLLSDATTLNANIEHRYRKNAYDNLLVAPNKDVNLIAKFTTRYQEPADWQEETGNAATISLSHAFLNGATWNAAFRSVHNVDDAKGYDNVSVLADNITLQRRARNQHNDRRYNYGDTNVSIPFATGSVAHNVLLGYAGGQDVTDFERIQFFNGATTGALARPGPGSLNINIYNPIYGVSPPLSAFGPGTVNRRYTRSQSSAFYFSDLITITEQWKLTLGARRSSETQLAEERKTPPLTSVTKDASATVPMAGLLWQPTKQWTFYSSYSTSFVPTVATAQDVTGQNPFTPEKSKQVEIGTKAELLKGRLTTTFSIFSIHRRDTLAPIACNAGVAGTCSQQVGGEQSKGFEWEINYRPMRNWQMQFGFSRADAKIELSNPSPTAPLVGARLTNAPLTNANMWSRYDFTEGAAKNFGVGFGLVYKSEHTGNLPSLADTRVLLLPAYTTADLAFYYRAQKLDFTLKFGNLFDKRFYEGVNSTTNELGVVPGAPRNITFSVRIPLW